METFLRELRLGARALARSRGFTAVAVLTLTLGIGMTAAVFSVINAVLLRSLGYKDPDRIVLLTGTKQLDAEVEEWAISYLDFVDWRKRERSQVFEDLVARTDVRSFNLMVEGEPEHIQGEMVSAGYFPLLGIEPVVGRVFTREEDQPPDSRAVAVVSHDLWKRHLGANRHLAGQIIRLNGQSYEVLGVLPPGFRGLTDEAQVWLPVTMAAKALAPPYIEMRWFRWLSAVGRLKPGASIEQAQAAMDTLTAGLEKELPETNRDIGVRLVSLSDAWFGELRSALLALFAASCFVLLIAWSNVANLLLARLAARQREFSVRAALGASRYRLISQMISETLLLALIGCGLGLLLAQAATRLLTASGAVKLKSFIHVSVDPVVVGVLLGLSVLCGLGFGLVPAYLFSRVDLSNSLKEGGRSAGSQGRRRLQSALVVTEVVLALVLLIGAGLMIRGFQHLVQRDIGFEPEEVLTFKLDLSGPRYREDAVVEALARQFLERLAVQPGVRSVALADRVPTDAWFGGNVTLEDRPDTAEGSAVTVGMHSVSPSYFSTLGIPLRQGRDFTLADGPGQLAVAIVSASMAQRYWPGRNPLGQRIKLGLRDDAEYPWITIVGVVGDAQFGGFADQGIDQPDIYFSLLQFPPRSPPVITVAARAEGIPAASLAPALRHEIRVLAPDLPPYDIATMKERLHKQTAHSRFLVSLMSVFAGVALILAIIGIYGVISFQVSQRTREIGVRMALGADRRKVVGMVVGWGVLLAAAGVIVGLAVSLVLTRVLESSLQAVLHGLGALDPWIFASLAIALLLVALAASYIPARRATRIAPASALRVD